MLSYAVVPRALQGLTASLQEFATLSVDSLTSCMLRLSTYLHAHNGSHIYTDIWFPRPGLGLSD